MNNHFIGTYFTQPSATGTIQHKVNFLTSGAGLNSEFPSIRSVVLWSKNPVCPTIHYYYYSLHIADSYTHLGCSTKHFRCGTLQPSLIVFCITKGT